MSRGPAPVQQSQVQRREPQEDKATRTLTVVQDKMRANNGAEAKAIRAMLGGNKALMERFISTTSRLLLQNSKILREASPESILDSIMQAASLGLEPLTDDGAIIVYSGTAQFRPMYRGYLKRIRNSGQVTDIDTQLVYENDDFEHQQGTDPWIRHVPARVMKDGDGAVVQDRGGYRGAYAWALMPSGKYIIEWMDEAEINYVRDHFSQAARDPNSPWRTSWGEMARKTVLRRLAKRLPADAVNRLLELDVSADNLEKTIALPSTVDEARIAAVEAAVGLIPDPTGRPAGPQAVPNGGTEPSTEGEVLEGAAVVVGGGDEDQQQVL